VTACAVRELREETGLVASPRPVVTEDTDWAVFTLEVPWGTEIAVDGTEHDRFEWVTVAEVLRRSRPAAVSESFSTGCAAMGLS
jgi:8-oxo-dGTP pyrophosphatase MutT (NUDIX family)